MPAINSMLYTYLHLSKCHGVALNRSSVKYLLRYWFPFSKQVANSGFRLSSSNMQVNSILEGESERKKNTKYYSKYLYFQRDMNIGTCNIIHRHYRHYLSQIAKFMGPTWDPPGTCRPQMGPMLAPWTLLSGMHYHWWKWSAKVS